MSSKEAINKLALDIIAHLNDLEGFDTWWDALDKDAQMETIREIKEMIEDAKDYI